MRLNKVWIAVAAAVVLLVAAFGGTALAQTPTDQGDSWQQMYGYCHGGGSGTTGGRGMMEGGMMGEGMMGGSGGGMGGGGMMGGW